LFKPSSKVPPARLSQASVREGLSLLLSDEPGKSIAYFESALGLQKGNPDAYYYLSRALIDIGELEVAISTLDLARERFPNLFTADGYFGVYPKLNLNKVNSMQSLMRNQTGMLKDQDLEILASLNLLQGAVDQIDLGEFEAAIPTLMKILEANPWNVHAYYYLGQAYANINDFPKARAVFETAVNSLPYTFQQTSRFGEYQGFDLDQKTVIAYYDVLSVQLPGISYFLSDEGSGGRLNGASLIDKYREAQEAWRLGQTPVPSLSQRFKPADLDRALKLASEKSILLVTPKHIKCSPEWDEYEVSFHLAGTCRSTIENYTLYHSDKIHTENHQLATPRSPEELQSGISEFRDVIAEARPDLVFFEGNFMGGMGCISREDFDELKQEFGFKLATMVIDINPPLENYAEYWSGVSDFLVAMNENPHLDKARSNCDVIVYPGVPMDLDIMRPSKIIEQDIDVLFIGARKRYRDFWCAHMLNAGIDLHMQFTEQSVENSLDPIEFICLHNRSKMVFNNGLISSQDHALNLRIFEAITAGTLLLQQDFDQLHDYFVPYVHYAPFNGVLEMGETAKMLLENEDIRLSITGAAGDWYDQCYGEGQFWLMVLGHLFAA